MGWMEARADCLVQEASGILVPTFHCCCETESMAKTQEPGREAAQAERAEEATVAEAVEDDDQGRPDTFPDHGMEMPQHSTPRHLDRTMHLKNLRALA